MKNSLAQHNLHLTDHNNIKNSFSKPETINLNKTTTTKADVIQELGL